MGDFFHVMKPGLDWTHEGEPLDIPYVRMRFRITLFFIYIFELFALGWPVTATILYGVNALLTWFWFVYALRIVLLFIPFVLYENVWALAGSDGYAGWINKVRIPAAMRPSFSLWAWAWISVVLCGLFGAILTVASLAAYPLFHGNVLLWGLTWGFSLLFTIESLTAVFILYYHGVYYSIRAGKKNKVGIV